MGTHTPLSVARDVIQNGARGPHMIYLGLPSRNPAPGNATHSLLSMDQPVAWAAELVQHTAWADALYLHQPTARAGIWRSYRPTPRCNWAAATSLLSVLSRLLCSRPLTGAALSLHLGLVGSLLVVRLNHGCSSCSVIFLQWLMSRSNTYPKSCGKHSSFVIGCSTRASADILSPLGRAIVQTSNGGIYTFSAGLNSTGPAGAASGSPPWAIPRSPASSGSSSPGHLQGPSLAVLLAPAGLRASVPRPSPPPGHFLLQPEV